MTNYESLHAMNMGSGFLDFPMLDSNLEIDADHMMGKSKALLKDDFYGYHDTAVWTKGGAGTPSVTIDAGGVGGILNLTTTTVGNDSTYIRSSAALVKGQGANQRLVFRIKTAETASYLMQFGVTSLATGLDDGACYADYVELNTGATAPTHVYTNYNNNGTPGTAHDTSVVKDGNYHVYEFIWNGDGSAIAVYRDRVLIDTISHTYDQNMYIMARIETLTTAAKTALVDLISHTVSRAT